MFFVELSTLAIATEARSQQCRPHKLVAEKDDAAPRNRDAVAVQLEKGMSEVLRGASERDHGQVPSAADKGHTPPAGTFRSGGNRVAGVG